LFVFRNISSRYRPARKSLPPPSSSHKRRERGHYFLVSSTAYPGIKGRVWPRHQRKAKWVRSQPCEKRRVRAHQQLVFYSDFQSLLPLIRHHGLNDLISNCGAGETTHRNNRNPPSSSEETSGPAISFTGSLPWIPLTPTPRFEMNASTPLTSACNSFDGDANSGSGPASKAWEVGKKLPAKLRKQINCLRSPTYV